jgi:hypothetical protein
MLADAEAVGVQASAGARHTTTRSRHVQKVANALQHNQKGSHGSSIKAAARRHDFNR